MPVSVTASTAWSPSVRTLTSIRPPSGVNFTALEMRLPSSWAIRVGSAANVGASSLDRTRLMFLRWASGRISATVSAAIAARSVPRSSMASCPDWIRDRNSRSPTRRSSRCALRSITSAK